MGILKGAGIEPAYRALLDRDGPAVTMVGPGNVNTAGGDRVLISGNPNLTMDLQIEGEDGDHNTGGLVTTAMRVLNAIPAVCDAAPGLLSVLDLPLVTGRGLMR